VIAASSTSAERPGFRIILSPGCALLLCLAAGCGWHVREEPPPRPVTAPEVTDFGELFQTSCAGCHGADGKIGPAPPLNDGIFLAIVPDEELRRVVTDGRQGTLMPAWSTAKGGPLTEKQVEILAAGIKKQKQWAPPAKIEGEIPSYISAGGGDKEAGAKVFATACAGCHGEQGRGGVKLDGKEKAIGAVNDAAFLALLSDQALRRLVITGRPDLEPSMPPYDQPGHGRPDDFKPLTPKDVSDVVALLAYWRVGGSINAK
jgi:cytochrome c oxidase cbb3-type subunit III